MSENYILETKIYERNRCFKKQFKQASLFFKFANKRRTIVVYIIARHFRGSLYITPPLP